MLIMQLAVSQTCRLFSHYHPLLSVPLTVWLCQHKILHFEPQHGYVSTKFFIPKVAYKACLVLMDNRNKAPNRCKTLKVEATHGAFSQCGQSHILQSVDLCVDHVQVHI